MNQNQSYSSARPNPGPTEPRRSGDPYGATPGNVHQSTNVSTGAVERNPVPTVLENVNYLVGDIAELQRAVFSLEERLATVLGPPFPATEAKVCAAPSYSCHIAEQLQQAASAVAALAAKLREIETRVAL